MAGLLADVFSFGDAAKRKVKGLLADPVGTLQQFVGNENDRARELNKLTAEATNEGVNALKRGLPDNGPATQRLTGLLAEGYSPTGMFIGASAKTWDKAAAEKAQQMLKAGADPRQVWKETGTFKGADGALRQEIDDSGAALLAQLPSPQRIKDISGNWMTVTDFSRAFPDTPEALAIRTRNTMTQGKLNGDTPRLPSTLDHPSLYDSYPSTRDVRVTVKNDMPIGEGAYAQDKDAIILSPLMAPELKSVKLHEIQHAIQQREGWAKGGSPESFPEVMPYDKLVKRSYNMQDVYVRAKANGGVDPETGTSLQAAESAVNELTKQIKGWKSPDDLYRSLAGEAEARATQARMNMNAAQRREVYPFDSYDVPVDQLIVRGGLLGEAKSVPKPPQAEALETARKNAVKMLGLPENNTPMDRAKALGFDTEAFHGTAKDVPFFDLGRAGTEMTSDWGRAAYATPSPSNAAYYATEAGANNAKSSAFAKYKSIEKQFGSNSDETFNALQEYREAAKAAEANPSGANIMPLLVNTRKSESYLPQSGMTDPYLFDTLRFSQSGKDVAKIVDANGGVDEIVVYNPARLRSRFAAFDPARVNENDLLGRVSLPMLGLLGAGALGAAAYTKD